MKTINRKMRKANIQFLFLLAAALGLGACSDQLDNDKGVVSKPATHDYAQNKFSIKLRPDVVGDVDNQARELSVPTGCAQLDDYLSRVGARKMTRIFPYAGRDEDKQRREGLNLWYTVLLDSRPGTRASVDKALAEGAADGIASLTEPVYTPRLERAVYTPVDEHSVTRAAGGAPFDDPLYARQWDFCNKGTVGNTTDSLGRKVVSSVPGADISAEPAWSITTGDPDVVVAVVDGGIDTSHPDLADAMWVNEDEIPGNGIDDDNNGFVDDRYGYNFAADTCLISPTRHGTHVAGTIAARNNNGRGVCGIAGGDGTPQSGVRVMACQIFRNNPDYDPDDPNSSETIGTGDRNLDAAAIVYGANNGAVISQNSWGFDLGYTATPQVIKEAIDYFNKYAGGSKTRKPLMQGGLVVFAAGNDGSRQPSYPAADDNVLSVAAFNPDFQASWYTNYGETVDISAPGGTQPERGLYPYEDGLPTSAVLSCVPMAADGRGGWAYMQGSSMACPHVSGIAALVVSKYGNASFTAEELRQRLLSGTKAMDYNDYVLAQYFDGMGLGYADALAALTDYDRDATPSVPQFIADSTRAGYGTVTLAWKSDNRADNGSLQYYVLYTSEKPITAQNYASASSHRINANFAATGEVFSRTRSRLQANTTYYFAVQAVARNGRASAPAILDGGVATLRNTPPTITSSLQGNRVRLAGKDRATIRFHLSDAENHEMSYSFSNAGTMSVTEEGNDLVVVIDASRYLPGIYPVTLTVADEYGATAAFDFIVEIVADRSPSLKSGITEIHVRVGDTGNIAVDDIVDDEEPSKITLKASGSDNLEVSASGDGAWLHVKGKAWGEGVLHLAATDIHGQTGEFDIPVFVYDNEGIYALYPTTVTTTLYLKVGDIVQGEAEIIVRNTAGKEALRRNFSTTSLDRVKRTLRIDVSELRSGAYILTLKCGGHTWEEKFVKQ